MSCETECIHAMHCSVHTVCSARALLHAVCPHHAPTTTTRGHQSQLTAACIGSEISKCSHGDKRAHAGTTRPLHRRHVKLRQNHQSKKLSFRRGIALLSKLAPFALVQHKVSQPGLGPDIRIFLGMCFFNELRCAATNRPGGRLGLKVRHTPLQSATIRHNRL